VGWESKEATSLRLNLYVVNTLTMTTSIAQKAKAGPSLLGGLPTEVVRPALPMNQHSKAREAANRNRRHEPRSFKRGACRVRRVSVAIGIRGDEADLEGGVSHRAPAELPGKAIEIGITTHFGGNATRPGTR
jgi:hypothetical protein